IWIPATISRMAHLTRAVPKLMMLWDYASRIKHRIKPLFTLATGSARQTARVNSRQQHGYRVSSLDSTQPHAIVYAPYHRRIYRVTVSPRASRLAAGGRACAAAEIPPIPHAEASVQSTHRRA